MPANVKVNSSVTTYNIRIRQGIIERLGVEILRLCEDMYCEVLIITDEKVSGLYLQQVITNFQNCPKPKGMKIRICELLIDSNEEAKNFTTVTQLLEDMADLGLSGKCFVVVLGGGVVCETAGFAAGCYMGGVKLVLVPTTLAAMIETSAWGSAFLNLSSGKNLAGMSFNPSLVICDTECLKTLSPKEYKSGIAEALKTSVMSGEELFRIFERGDVQNNINSIIEGCIRYRAEVSVEIRRKCLGYAIGNAIESLSGYVVQHGNALAQGIGITARASAKMNWCSKETSDRIINALAANNLPSTCRKFTAGEISQALLNGRRISGSTFELAVVTEIGHCESKNINADKLEDVILSGIGA
ncbi:MAG: iron-containing alcohol dehydrogenase [Synergistaceae bacterium]|nr:iron-containing alcohol dehydrogenase [Synergistaceae bacterium]